MFVVVIVLLLMFVCYLFIGHFVSYALAESGPEWVRNPLRNPWVAGVSYAVWPLTLSLATPVALYVWVVSSIKEVTLAAKRRSK